MHKIIIEDINNIIAENLPWENFAGKTILISGASGFLPSYLVHTILALNDSDKLSRKAKVIAIVRDKTKAEIKFKQYLARNDFRLINHDISLPLEDLNETIHYIIHAASQASPKYYSTDPVGTLSANTFGTAYLLELARKNPIECFLFFSSGEVYGQTLPSITKTSEQDYSFIDPINVRSCYAESKRMGETMCIAWHHQFGIPTKIARPFHTYGPGMQLNDGRVFADFVADIVNNKNIIMKSDGSAIRAFCYLSDATIGFFTVLFKGKIAEAYNVANDETSISILELANTLASLFPEKNLHVVKNESAQQKNYLKSSIEKTIPDNTKLRALGWKPKYNIRDGFLRTINSYFN